MLISVKENDRNVINKVKINTLYFIVCQVILRCINF